MIRNILVIIGMVLLATGTAQEGKEFWNFDADQTGVIARGFTGDVGEWKVIADPTGPSLPNVLVSTGMQ